MSVKKTIKEQFDPLYLGFDRIAKEIHVSLDAFSNKLDAKKKPTLKSRIIAIRNWLTHFLLWFILAYLLSSCFVSGRTIHVSTPRVDVSADTATAYTWPYNTKFQ